MMRESSGKERWGKPKLIILTRGRVEENVLGGCKLLTHPGPSNANDACPAYGDPCTPLCSTGNPS